jgi:hypothetical protein
MTQLGILKEEHDWYGSIILKINGDWCIAGVFGQRISNEFCSYHS